MSKFPLIIWYLSFCFFRAESSASLSSVILVFLIQCHTFHVHFQEMYSLKFFSISISYLKVHQRIWLYIFHSDSESIKTHLFIRGITNFFLNCTVLPRIYATINSTPVPSLDNNISSNSFPHVPNPIYLLACSLKMRDNSVLWSTTIMQFLSLWG